MLFSSLVAIVSAALVSATPAKRVDDREWIHLEVAGGCAYTACLRPARS